MPWTFKHATTDQSFAAWGFSACKVRKLNQDKGSFTCQIAGDARASLPFVHDDAVELRLDGVVKWRGRFISARRTEEGNAETITLRFDDLWHKLEQAPFVGGYHGGLLFGTLVPGESFTPDPMSAALTAIVEAADAYHGGGLMQAGTLHASLATLQPPPTQITGATCADALRAALRRVPGVTAAWDYSTTPPTLQFTRRADATAITLDLDPDVTVITSSDLIPRPDLQSRGVVITWLQEIFGVTSNVYTDTAGETTGDRIIRLTLPLAPAGGNAIGSTPNLTERVVVTSEANTWAISSATWWATYGGLPANCSVLTVGVGTASSGSGLSRIYKSGSIPSWLNVEAHYGVRTITGYLTLRFTDSVTGGTVDKQQVIVLNFPVTDLDGTYTRPVVSPETAIEDESAVLQLPTYGLAAAMHAGLSTLHYQGTVTTTRADVAHEIDVGNVLNLSNGLAEFATMNAHVFSVAYDFDLGQAAIEVGPSLNLNPDDWGSQQAQLSRDPALSGLEARGSNAAGGAGASGEVQSGITPAPPPPGSVSDGQIVKASFIKGDYKYELDVENGLVRLQHLTDVAKRFQVNVTNGVFQFHLTGPDEEEVVIKPRKAKICVFEGGVATEKDVLVMMSDDIPSLDSYTLPTASW